MTLNVVDLFKQSRSTINAYGLEKVISLNISFVQNGLENAEAKIAETRVVYLQAPNESNQSALIGELFQTVDQLAQMILPFLDSYQQVEGIQELYECYGNVRQIYWEELRKIESENIDLPTKRSADKDSIPSQQRIAAKKTNELLFGPIQQLKVNPRGISNLTTTDCFMNSILQLIVHSPLRAFLSDKGNLESSEKEPDANKAFQLLSEFFEDYANSKELVTTQFRSLLGFSEKEPEDAVEFITAIFGKFQTKDISSKVSKKIKVIGDVKELSEKAEKSSDGIKLNELGEVQLEEELYPLISIILPKNKEEIGFEEAWHVFINPAENQPSTKFNQEGYCFSAEYQEKKTY